MVCPFRKITEVTKTVAGKLSTEKFAQCCYNECPYYAVSTSTSDSVQCCRKVLKEISGGV